MKDLLNTQLQDASAPTHELIRTAAQNNGISPSLLASQININPDEYSGDEANPVSGYSHYGIKGNIPEGIPHSPVMGEVNGQQIKSANFPTHEDAMNAKAAIIKDSLDGIKSEAEKRGTPISDQVAEFIHHGGDNGMKMMKGYADAGVLNDGILTKKPAGFGAVYNKAKEGYDSARGFDENFGDPGKEVTPDVMKNWNSLQNWVKTKGYAGKEELDHNPELRQKLFDQYNKENPDQPVDSSMVQPIQQEMQKYRQWVLDGVKNGSGALEKGTNEQNFMKNLSKVDGIYGKDTSQWSFPAKYMETKKDGKVIDKEYQGLSTRKNNSVTAGR